MDAGVISLPDSINPNNFPAKLWRLVNNPAYKAIRWDDGCEVIVIEQHRFQSQILSPSAKTLDNADTFKTTNFSSFVRQLNLYGFKKANTDAVKVGNASDCAGYHYFSHPNFKRNHPELVATLRRLTVNNKAKIEAGEDVNIRAGSRYLRQSGGGGGGGSSLLSPTRQELTHPYFPNRGQATTAHNGTPVPPRFLTRGRGAALRPTVLTTVKGMPASVSHQNPGVAASSNVPAQQCLLARSNHGNPNVTFNAQYQPGYYSPVCRWYHQNLETSHMAGRGLSFSPRRYYQASYPACVDHNQDSKNKECGINLNTVFQMADEVMRTPPNNSLVRVVTPEKPNLVFVPFSTITMRRHDPASAMNADPSYPGPIIVSVTGGADLDTFKQQEKSVISPPEKMPEDAIFKVSSDDEEDIEVVDVEVY